jgi:hypothetical protein
VPWKCPWAAPKAEALGSWARWPARRGACRCPHRDQIRLGLRCAVLAIAIPILRSTEITQVRTTVLRQCWPPPTPPNTASCSLEEIWVTLPWPVLSGISGSGVNVPRMASAVSQGALLVHAVSLGLPGRPVTVHQHVLAGIAGGQRCGGGDTACSGRSPHCMRHFLCRTPANQFEGATRSQAARSSTVQAPAVCTSPPMLG